MRKLGRILFGIFLVIIGLSFLFAFYNNSLINVNQESVEYYEKLKQTLESKGYKKRTYVISGKRSEFINSILAKYGSAVTTSTHLKGEAIDIIVLDINNDGESNYKDVDIIYNLLDKIIIQNQGGIGTYKNKSGFFTQQMVHFDCRGYRARWNK